MQNEPNFQATRQGRADPTPQPSEPICTEPLRNERIQELIDWTEHLLEADDELKELVGESHIRMILDSLKAELPD